MWFHLCDKRLLRLLLSHPDQEPEYEPGAGKRASCMVRNAFYEDLFARIIPRLRMLRHAWSGLSSVALHMPSPQSEEILIHNPTRAQLK